VLEQLSRVETHVASVVEQARADGDLAEDVDPAALARFGTALALGYHLIHSAGAPEPDRDGWVSLMAHVVSSLRS
jgi:hypothetical protein